MALAIGQWLEKRKVAWLGEASVALIIGILMGLLSRVFTFSATYVSWMSFQVGISSCCTTHQACSHVVTVSRACHRRVQAMMLQRLVLPQASACCASATAASNSATQFTAVA